jgi:SAM-dependent methyltransferase
MDNVKKQLREAYDRSAQERQQSPQAAWKIEERQAFYELAAGEGKNFLLEIGAGPGKDSLYFKNQGMQVISTDLSAEMVKLCRAKGLEAYQMDFLNLDFPDSHFDAVYALNCLLHVQEDELPRVLNAIKGVLKPNGLFFMGVYGGFDQQEIWEQDQHKPKRFFSFYTDDRLLEIVTQLFLLHDFKRILVPDLSHPQMIFQRLILRKEQ